MANPGSKRKVRNHIPNDLVFSILSKLPLKSLKRFGCVNNTWSHLFENSHFMNKFRNNFLSNPQPCYNDTSLILYSDHTRNWIHLDSYHLLSGERYENLLKLQSPNPYQEENPVFTFFGCAAFTGTVLLKEGWEDTLMLWNPATHEFKAIPPSPARSVPPYRAASNDIYGFGYNHMKDDFKIIRYIQFERISESKLRLLNVRKEDVPWDEISYEPVWEIYSLRCNSWRKLDMNMPCWNPSAPYSSLCIDGICHWWANNENCDEYLMASFNLNNEIFFTTPMPLDIPSIIDTNFHLIPVKRLVVLKGSIASISWYFSKTTFHISILAELGVKESWTKLFVVGPLLDVQDCIGAGKNGDVFFHKKDGQLVCFDLSTQETKELGFKGTNFYDISIYKESCLLIGEINH